MEELVMYFKITCDLGMSYFFREPFLIPVIALLPLTTNQNINSSKGKRPREPDVVGASSTSRKHVRIDAADSSVSALELGADDENQVALMLVS